MHFKRFTVRNKKKSQLVTNRRAFRNILLVNLGVSLCRFHEYELFLVLIEIKTN